MSDSKYSSDAEKLPLDFKPSKLIFEREEKQKNTTILEFKKKLIDVNMK